MKLALLLMLALPVFAAQIPLPELIVTQDSDGCHATVRNVHSVSLAAFWIEQSPSFTYSEDATGGHSLIPGSEKTIALKDSSACESPSTLRITAAIYVDGTSAGSTERIETIMAQRRARLANIREAIRRIEEADAQKQTKAEILQKLQDWRDGLARDATPEGRKTATLGINTAVALLRDHSVSETVDALKQLLLPPPSR